MNKELYKRIVEDYMNAKNENNKVLEYNLGEILRNLDRLSMNINRELSNDDCLILLKSTYYNIIDSNYEYEISNDKNIQVVLNKIKDYFKELNYNIDTYNKLILSNGIMYKSYKENIETSDNDNSIANFLKVISHIILVLTIVGIIGILIFSTTNKIIIISSIIIIKLIITGFISAIVFRTFAEIIYILDDIRKKI